MKKHPILALGLGALLLAFGCDSKSGGTGSGSDSTVVAPDTVAIRSTGQECANLQPGQFCAQGLDILRLGDSLTWNNSIKTSLPDAQLKDTVFTELSQGPEGADSVSWFAKILRLPDGDIYMDADFEQGQFLGRIRIESGRYHHSSGLRVGSTGKELKAWAQNAFVAPFEAYHIMEVIVPYENSRLIFQFPEEGILKKDGGEYTLADIPDQAKVVRIVVM